jgi:hypothetical protein
MFLLTGRLFWKTAILAEGSSVIDSQRGRLYRRFAALETSSQHGARALTLRMTY